jgi:hypothetical protein
LEEICLQIVGAASDRAQGQTDRLSHEGDEDWRIPYYVFRGIIIATTRRLLFNIGVQAGLIRRDWGLCGRQRV